MIKLINKAFRERPRSIHHDRQKVRIILNKANKIVDIIEFYDVDMALKSGNLNALLTNRLKQTVVNADSFTLDVIKPD